MHNALHNLFTRDDVQTTTFISLLGSSRSDKTDNVFLYVLNRKMESVVASWGLVVVYSIITLNLPPGRVGVMA